MGSRRSHIQYLLTGCLLACFGCPISTNPAAINSTTAVPIDTALSQSGSPVVLGTSTPICVDAGQPSDSVHLALYQQLNAYRAQNGLKPLIYSRTLEAAGDADMQDLYARNFFDHINPDGEDPGQRAMNAGFCHKYVGENIAAGQTSVGNVMIAWQNSPHHNENMLDPDYVYVGMGHFIDPNGRQYWAQEFAFDVPAVTTTSK